MLRGVDTFQDQSCSPTDELLTLVSALQETMEAQEWQAQTPMSCDSLFPSPEKDSGEQVRRQDGTYGRQTYPVAHNRGRRQSIEVDSTVMPAMTSAFRARRTLHMNPEPEGRRTQSSVAVQTAMTGSEKREKIAALIEKERTARVMEKSALEWQHVVEELEQERINLLRRVSEAKREMERSHERESKLQVSWQHVVGQLNQQQDHEMSRDHNQSISHVLSVASKGWNRKCQHLLLRNTISHWRQSYMSRQTAVWKSFIDRKNMEHADESVILHETVGMWKDKALRRKAVDARIQLKEEQALFSALFDWRQCRSSASAAASRTIDLRSTKATIELCRAFHIWSGLAKLTAAISSAKYALLMDIKGRAAVASATRRMMQSHFATWKTCVFPGTSTKRSDSALRRSHDTNTTGTLSTQELHAASPLRVFRLRRSPPSTPPKKSKSSATVREEQRQDAQDARRRRDGAEDHDATRRREEGEVARSRLAPGAGRTPASSGRMSAYASSRRRRSSSSSSQASSAWNVGLEASGDGGEQERRRARLRVIDWQTRATNQWRGSFLARKVLREWHKFSMQEHHVLSVLSNFYPEFDYG